MTIKIEEFATTSISALVEALNAEMLRAFPLIHRAPSECECCVAFEMTDVVLANHSAAEIVERMSRTIKQQLQIQLTLSVVEGQAVRETIEGRRQCFFLVPKLEE